MATFEVQVSGLTSLTIDDSSSPTRAELNQFLTDGAKEVINSLPPNLLPLCASSQTFTSGSADTLTTGKILNVFRSDGDINQPCRKIQSRQKGRVSDPEDMAYATITDPIYYIDNNTLDVLPSGGSCSYSAVEYPAVSYTHESISAFPNEAEHLVVLYGSIKSIQNVLGNKSSNSDITIAIDAANTELDKIVTNILIPVAPAINEISYTDATTGGTVSASTIGAITVSSTTLTNLGVPPIYESPTETISGVVWATEYPTQASAITTAFGLIKDAVDQAETAGDKFASGTSDSVFDTDSTWTAASSQLTRVKAALDNAEDVINSNQPSATTDAYGALALEDTEIVQSALSVATTEIRRAQAHIQEWSAIGDMRVKEINAALSEAKGYADEVQSRLAPTSAKINEYQAKVQDSLNSFNRSNSEYEAKLQEAVQQAQLDSQKALTQARLDADDAKQESAQATDVSKFNTAQAQALHLANEAKTLEALVANNNSKIQKYSNELQSYQAQVGKLVQSAQGYINEVQSRLQVDTAQYSWYEKQQAKLQADYDKGLQALS